MARIVSVATALPSHVLRQDEARRRCEEVYGEREELARLLSLFERSGVERRHFAFPPEYHLAGRSFEERNDDFVRGAVDLAERAARECLRRAGVEPKEVDQLFLVTTTGLATPSLDALLAGRLGLRPDVRRSPLFGLGCAGGAGALIRADEILKAEPARRALVVAVELAGQVFSPRADRPVDVVGAALFGDGAAAVLLQGAGGGPRIRAARSMLFEGTERLMGWRFTSDGMRLVLSPEVTDLVRHRFGPAVGDLLAEAGWTRGDVGYWILHPGGRKILEAYREALDLSEEALAWSRRSLAEVGNLSSAAVLFVLADVIAKGRPGPGDRGVLAALGPGFGAELLALEWSA
ncbi:MAG TPA: 3-oxoacyl-[acyl-carrier-protein] synthase III C-terminal domain-containing protein [Planctomycetota bacterium]|nr:3-oxoacyl-[acyl-carrier-protein] synthase III C-terminal domain-containing protein [Planctomycetota bacterium]